MEELFKTVATHIGLAIEAVGILIIAIGALKAVVNILPFIVKQGSGTEQRAVWLQYARWLAAGLTFQLAGDIVHSAIAPSWDDNGRLAAIAVIRTFLTYFLDRDIDTVREKQRAASAVEKVLICKSGAWSSVVGRQR